MMRSTVRSTEVRYIVPYVPTSGNAVASTGSGESSNVIFILHELGVAYVLYRNND
jgi:hypothetical protein